MRNSQGGVARMILSNGVLRTCTLLVGRVQRTIPNGAVNYGGTVVQEAGSTVVIDSIYGWWYDLAGYTGYPMASFDISQPDANTVNAPESSYTLKGGSLTVANSRTRVWPYGKFCGYGTVTAGGKTLDNCGRVVADGFGTDNTFDLSQYGTVDNERTNGTERTDCGWYAVNKGKLVLPSLATATGSQTLNWGEAQANSALSMVNSVRLSNFAVTTAGSVSISLLATNHSEVTMASALVRPVGVWNFAAVNGLEFSSTDLTFRYDDALAASLGVAENRLKLFHYVAGIGWLDCGVSVDTDTHRLMATGVTELGLYAVAQHSTVPPQGSVISIN